MCVFTDAYVICNNESYTSLSPIQYYAPIYIYIYMAWPASGAAWCHVTHAAVPVLYHSLYVELSCGRPTAQADITRPCRSLVRKRITAKHALGSRA